jgi:membrane associated rhomboid family serine protease
MPKLFFSPDSEQINLCTLVLSASRIPYALVQADGQWEIWVKEGHLEAAQGAIAAYAAENPSVPLTTSAPIVAVKLTPSGLWVAALLLLVHVAAVYYGALDKMVQVYGADAGLIMKGEVYRTVTALWLHAGPLHLAGNMLGILLFGTAVCTVTGVARGWLMILLTAAMGNLLNAVFYQSGHLSIGASTAVFSAIGILAGIRFSRRAKGAGWKQSPWLPLAAGLGLLGMLGTGGVRTDLMAHLFGLLSGGAVGIAYGHFVWRPLPGKYETWSWFLIALILAAAFWSGAQPP